MKNIFVFPFTPNQLPLLRFQNLIRSDINIIPIAPPCYKHSSDDLARLDNGSAAVYSNKDYRDAKSTDCFCFTGGDKSFESLKFGASILKEVINYSCRIMIDLTGAERRQFQALDPALYQKVKNIEEDFSVRKEIDENAQLKSISVPVYAVGSISSNNNKQEVCLSITQRIMQSGKRVVYICSEKVYEFLGINTFHYDSFFSLGPDLMILKINHFFYHIQESTNCDCIVCDIPGSLFKYNDKLIASAGVFGYIISQALPIQKLVCCVPASYNGIDFYKMIANEIHNIFKVREVIFHMSNYMLANENRPIEGQLPGYYLPYSLYLSVLKQVNGTNPFIYDLRRIP